ncbi:uncharacterized protein [Gossypium hirsutum]|uniref:RNA-directed DNA polymerase homolog n=1 Tax=Gossypium hirsutum TaxID=3635 RepID=A0ABM2ZXD5_GOSHI|nr:uncharacterized protein LOC107960941 [Gossypium hirsutum]
MHPKDMKKTTFITLWGTFCYKVMPFGLKKAGATYQKALVTLFHNMMHKKIEVYVEDMIAKSRTEREHVPVLRKLFLRLRKFQLKHNPAKCIFGARSGKLLGFVVSEKGIEIDPDKVKAIPDLPPPRTQKEVRDVWNKECHEAFDKIKQYLSNTPVLSPSRPDKPLILYLTVFDNSMGCVLGQHDETGKKEKVVKGSAIADILASRALEDYESLNFDFPNEDLMYVAAAEEDSHENYPWKLNFDGASNAIELIEEFDSVTFCYLPRNENQMANALATLASMIKVNKSEDMNPIQISIYEAPAPCYSIEEEENDDHPWYQDILRYLKNREYPDHATENDTRTLRRLAIDYVLDGEILYKKGKDQVLLRTSTGEPPFSLVYRMEAVLPIEVEFSSLRVLAELKLDEAE